MVDRTHGVATAAFVLFTCLWCSTTAAANDTFGLFWDEAYTVTSIDTPSVPATLSAWLVLQNPSATGGVLGWECRMDAVGPAYMTAVTLMGAQTINVTTPPDYVVGLVTPLPPGQNVVLAELEVLVTDRLSAHLRLEPVTRPSVDGSMSYITTDDPGTLVPASPVGGTWEAAWINRSGPVVVAIPEQLEFGTVAVGFAEHRMVKLTNAGDADAELDLAFDSACPDFRLAEDRVHEILAPGASRDVVVVFEPQSLGAISCEMTILPPSSGMMMSGTGREPEIAGSAPDTLDFGELALGMYDRLPLTIVNTGELELPVDPVLQPGCGDFQLNWGESFVIQPGSHQSLWITYQPLALGSHECVIDLGAHVGPVLLTGTARESVGNGAAPDSLIFADQVVGQDAEEVLEVRNTGDVAILVTPQIQLPCDAFSVIASSQYTVQPGYSVWIRVRFLPVTAGAHSCGLDLGGAIGVVRLFGEAYNTPPVIVPDPSTVIFPPTMVGGASVDSLTLTNTGGDTAELDIALPPESVGYTVLRGGGPRTIIPTGSHTVVISFAPPVRGVFDFELSLGADFPSVRIVGEGVVPPPARIEADPASLAFPATLVDSTSIRSLVLTNAGGESADLTIVLPAGTAGFAVVSGGGQQAVAPAESHEVVISFTPSSADSFAAELSLGGLHPGIPVAGLGIVPSPPKIQWEPDRLEFAATIVDSTRFRTLTLSNVGELPAELDIGLLRGGAGFTIAEGGGALVLDPGRSHAAVVAFTPKAAGAHTDSVTLGRSWPGVPVLGTGTIPTPDLVATPTMIDFPGTLVGDRREASVTLENTGNVSLELDPVLDPPDAPFSIVAGHGASVLAPGDTHPVTVAFVPDRVDTFTAALLTGPEGIRVPVGGVGVAPNTACGVTPRTWDFGTASVGSTIRRAVIVANVGNVPLVIEPVSAHPVFTVITGRREIPVGSQAYLTISFSPTDAIDYVGQIDLGAEACGSVSCYGAGRTAEPVRPRVGLFLDPAGTHWMGGTSAPMQVVETYLILMEPGLDVAGWELAVGIDGDAWPVEWVLEGEALNVANPPEFVVGMTWPLPAAPAVRLATIPLLVAHPTSTIYAMLTPTSRPSISAAMAWVDGAGALHAMETTTGFDAVLVLNDSGYVPVETPSPTLTVAGNRATLRWALPTPAEGCHVYRRDATGGDTRLTDAPLVALDGDYVYHDDLAILRPGVRFWYRYATIKNGAETAASPEVAFTVPQASLPQVDRLLPNIPNPFNPETELRFELRRPGPVQLTIHDLTGRLVRTVVAADLAAGPHARKWNGRDASGRPVPSGTYHVRLVTGDHVTAAKILLLK